MTQPPPVLPADIAVPELVRNVVQKCMQRKPEQRYQSVEPLIDDLRRCIDLVLQANEAKAASEEAALPEHVATENAPPAEDDEDVPVEVALQTSDLPADPDAAENPTEAVELP